MASCHDLAYHPRYLEFLLSLSVDLFMKNLGLRGPLICLDLFHRVFYILIKSDSSIAFNFCLRPLRLLLVLT